MNDVIKILGRTVSSFRSVCGGGYSAGHLCFSFSGGAHYSLKVCKQESESGRGMQVKCDVLRSALCTCKTKNEPKFASVAFYVSCFRKW